MKISEYLSRLDFGGTPSREAQTVLRNLREDLSEDTIPVVKEIADGLRNHQYRSRYAKEVNQAFAKRVRFDNLPDALVRTLERMEDNIPVLEKMVKGRWFDLVTSHGARQFRHATVLRYIDMMVFFPRYTRLMLYRLLAEESMASGQGAKLTWPKGQLKWLDDRLNDYVIIMTLLDQPSSDLQRMINNASEISVTDETEETLAASRSASADPLQTHRLSGFSRFNPFFAAGKAIVELQVYIHKSRKEEVDALKLRLQDLKEIEEGRPDPKRQQIITKMEGRIDDLQHKVRTVEEANEIT